MNIDSHGLIVHKGGDGGDTMADHFRYLYAAKLNGTPNEKMLESAIKFLFPLKGIGVRHPTMWTDPCDLSRDQQTPAVVCLLAYGRHDLVNDIYRRHMARDGRYQNLDWANWEHWNIYDPKNRDWKGDVIMLIGSILRVLASYISNKGLYKDINHQVCMIQAGVAGHSKWTKAACRFYSKFRYGGVFYPWQKFHEVDNPEIATEYIGPIQKYILNQ